MVARIIRQLFTKSVWSRTSSKKSAEVYSDSVSDNAVDDDTLTLIHNLCDDILILIIKQAVSLPAASLTRWKNSLPLLAVCHNWRALALPIVYSRGFLDLNVQSSNSQLNFTGRLSKLGYASNVSLLVKARQTHLVKSLHISVLKPTPALALYRAITELLCFREAMWKNIGSLVFEFGPKVLAMINAEHSNPQSFVGLLTRNICNVKKLDICVFDIENESQSGFVNMLTDAYLPHLQNLSVDTDITLNSGQFSTYLTKLELSMSPSCIQALPTINPDILQQLSLFDVAPNFKWNIFSAESKANVLKFSSLKKLSIGFAADKPKAIDNADIDTAPSVQFPVLKNLYIFRCPQNCMLLSRNIYPPKLDKIVVECIPGYKALASLKNLAPSKELTIMLSDLKSEDRFLYYKAINDMFKTNKFSDKPAVVILDKQSIPDPNTMQWCNLSYLSIRTIVTTNLLLKLLDKLPGLECLTATYLMSNHLPSDVFIPHPSVVSCKSKQRVFANIKSMYIGFALDPRVTQQDVSFVLYLATCTSLLQSLKLTPALLPRMEHFQTNYARDYPHLQNARLVSNMTSL